MLLWFFGYFTGFRNCFLNITLTWSIRPFKYYLNDLNDQYNVHISIPGYAERKCSEDGFWLAEDGEEAMDPSWWV